MGKERFRVALTTKRFCNVQARKIDARSKDTLKCMIQVEMKYRRDSELISGTFVSVSVIEILQNDNCYGDMLDE